MLQGEHSAILSTFIKQPFVIKIFVLSFFEWPLKTGFTVVGFVTFIYTVSRLFFFIPLQLPNPWLGIVSQKKICYGIPHVWGISLMKMVGTSMGESFQD